MPAVVVVLRCAVGLLSVRVVEPARALVLLQHPQHGPAMAQIAAFPQACVNTKHQALHEGLGKPLAAGLDLEASLGRTVIEEAGRGAQRFASGEGRHAKF